MADNGAEVSQEQSNKSSSKFGTISTVFLIVALGQFTRIENQGVDLYWLNGTLKVVLPFTVAVYGVRRGSLDRVAGLLAVLVGTIHSVVSCNFSFSMIAFFLFGSQLSKWKLSVKQTFEALGESGAKRKWQQVFCNGAVSSFGSLAYLLSISHHYRTYFSMVVLSSISCCCGDTFASEFGSVVESRPRLITTLRPVPRGTNGGISLAGTVASIVGGMLIGLIYYATQQWTLTDTTTPFSLILVTSLSGGFLGSLMDSLLGATLQYSGYNIKSGRISHTPPKPNDQDEKYICGREILTNNQVNLLSSLVTGLLVPYLLLLLF